MPRSGSLRRASLSRKSTTRPVETVTPNEAWLERRPSMVSLAVAWLAVEGMWMNFSASCASPALPHPLPSDGRGKSDAEKACSAGAHTAKSGVRRAKSPAPLTKFMVRGTKCVVTGKKGHARDAKFPVPGSKFQAHGKK